jgi:membrane protease YdiL (CAAX protease family)
VTVISIALSSVAFGLAHGQQWFVGILAGLAYAGLMKWKGSLSVAIVAHATTNLLLTIWVISQGDWSQW